MDKPEPIVRFPPEVFGHPHHVQIHSFSGALLAKQGDVLATIKFVFSEIQCFICPPIRLGHSTWRPIPQLNEQNVVRFLGHKLEDLPLQVAVFQAEATKQGATLSQRASRGTEYLSTLPPDTFVVIAPGAALTSVLDRLAIEFVPKLLDWLRVLSRQWWIGQPTERHTGNMHFEFEINEKGEMGPHFGVRGRQATAPDDMRLIGHEIWLDAVSAAAKGDLPKLTDTMRCDIAAAYFNRDDRMTIILTCCWIELLRNAALDRGSKRVSDLKAGPTDLLKHLSMGTERLAGRDLSKDEPDAFALLRACWISRGHLAHGNSASWDLNGSKVFRDLPAADFFDLLGKIEAWIEACDVLARCPQHG